MPNNQRAFLKKLSVFLAFSYFSILLLPALFFVSHISNFLFSITQFVCFVFLFLSILLFSLKSPSQSQDNF